jgi:hypothetical protein
VNALLALDGAPPADVDGFRGAANEIEDLGWLLGVLANANGAEVLLERRERDGLAPMVRAVSKCLRRERRELALPDRELPRLRAGAPATQVWRVTWAVGSWLLECARSLPAGARLDWELDVSRERPLLVCHAATTQEIEALSRALAHALEGIEVQSDARRSMLAFEPGCMIARGVGE